MRLQFRHASACARQAPGGRGTRPVPWLPDLPCGIPVCVPDLWFRHCRALALWFILVQSGWPHTHATPCWWCHGTVEPPIGPGALGKLLEWLGG